MKTAGVHDYDKFDVKSSEYLSNVYDSISLFNCTDQSCKLYEVETDRPYGDIIKSLNMAANNSIPRGKYGTRRQTAGWNDIIKESHDVARSDFKFWCSHGKPRYVYEAMRRSRSQFKYAFRQCKRSENTIKSDRLAGDLLQDNVVDFWKNVRNLTSNKASNSTCIDAVVGEQNIADYWRSHYEGIFNSVQNTTHQNEILRKLETTEFHEDMTVTTNEVAKVIKGLKQGKEIGPDNVVAEALMHSNNRLHYLLLGVCFSAVLIHSYLPQGLMDTKIIPLVKNKCGKLSDKNNYKPGAISNSWSKVF